MTDETKTPSNPRMQNPYGVFAGEARNEDFFSLRDHFAGLAMQASLASPELMEVVSETSIKDGSVFDAIAKASYKAADAMLKQREYV